MGLPLPSGTSAAPFGWKPCDAATATHRFPKPTAVFPAVISMVSHLQEQRSLTVSTVLAQTRLAVWVAVQRRAVSFTTDPANTLVQVEPIGTAAPRAANAADQPQVRSEETAQGTRRAIRVR